MPILRLWPIKKMSGPDEDDDEEEDPIEM